MSYAKYQRTLQFTAGPNEFTFRACEEHKEGLTDRNKMPNCFFGLESDKVEDLNEEDGELCWFCQEP